MNNKKLGTDFEREAVKFLSQNGYWVHFLTPDSRGNQPFDIIASKNDEPVVFDCKTSSVKWFGISRLEENQIMAFELWHKKGNKKAFILIKYNEEIYQIPYRMLNALQKINLEENKNFIVK